MKLYENFEKAYKLIVESEKYEQLSFKSKCEPSKIGEDKLIDDMIKHFKKKEEYEKCSILIKIKCWRHNQDKKYNL